MTALALALLLSASPADVPLDKVAHASVSANLVLGGAAVAHALGAPRWVALGVGVGLATVAGLLRELLGNRDAWDLAANAVGIAAGSATYAVIVLEF